MSQGNRADEAARDTLVSDQSMRGRIVWRVIHGR